MPFVFSGHLSSGINMVLLLFKNIKVKMSCSVLDANVNQVELAIHFFHIVCRVLSKLVALHWSSEFFVASFYYLCPVIVRNLLYHYFESRKGEDEFWPLC